MYTTREQFDPDLDYAPGSYSKLPSEVNCYNMYCSSCHGSFYLDKDFYEQTVYAMEQGSDNPFLCDECQDEINELDQMHRH